MNAELENRCKELLDQGKIHATRIPSYRGTQNSWYPADMIGELQAWIASVANLIRVMATPDTYYLQECHRILEHKDLSMGVPYLIIQKLIGLLGSLLEESQRGLLRKAEYIFVASTFDDFLDRASDYHKGGKMMESSVLGQRSL